MEPEQATQVIPSILNVNSISCVGGCSVAIGSNSTEDLLSTFYVPNKA